VRSLPVEVSPPKQDLTPHANKRQCPPDTARPAAIGCRASERRVCPVVGQHRSTQRHPAKVVSIEEGKLRHRLREIASEHVRWGRRMAYRLLRRVGWTVNHKRVQRLWREEGLQRPSPRKRKRARPADGSVRRHRADHPHQVWPMDFQFDATADGRRLKFLNVIDEHSRLCLAIRVDSRCKVKDVVAVLEVLTSLYLAPAFIRSDNGPESNCYAEALRLRSGSTGLVRGQRTPPAQPTSSLDPHGKTALPSRSTGGSGTSSSTPSYSPRLLRLSSWPMAG
jgi:putative transposase